MNDAVTIPRLHDGQRRVVDEAGRFNVLLCGRRFGKTVLGRERASRETLDGGKVAWFAPDYTYLDRPGRPVSRPRPGNRAGERAKAQALVENGRRTPRLHARQGGAGTGRALRPGDHRRGGDRRRSSGASGRRASGRPSFERPARRGSSRPRKGETTRTGLRARASRATIQSSGIVANAVVDEPHVPREEIEAQRGQLPDWIFAQEYEAILGRRRRQPDLLDGSRPRGACARPRRRSSSASTSRRASTGGVIGLDRRLRGRLGAVVWTGVCGT